MWQMVKTQSVVITIFIIFIINIITKIEDKPKVASSQYEQLLDNLTHLNSALDMENSIPSHLRFFIYKRNKQLLIFQCFENQISQTQSLLTSQSVILIFVINLCNNICNKYMNKPIRLNLTKLELEEIYRHVWLPLWLSW